MIMGYKHVQHTTMRWCMYCTSTQIVSWHLTIKLFLATWMKHYFKIKGIWNNSTFCHWMVVWMRIRPKIVLVTFSENVQFWQNCPRCMQMTCAWLIKPRGQHGNDLSMSFTCEFGRFGDYFGGAKIGRCYGNNFFGLDCQ